MGYTHYWKSNRTATVDEFTRIGKAFEKVVKASNVTIGDGHGNPGSKPTIDWETIRFNGIHPDDYETMVVMREARSFEFCKTQYRPYDILVVALLLLMDHYAPGVWTISSDGDASDWKDGVELVEKVLGEKVEIPQEVRNG